MKRLTILFNLLIFSVTLFAQSFPDQTRFWWLADDGATIATTWFYHDQAGDAVCAFDHGGGVGMCSFVVVDSDNYGLYMKGYKQQTNIKYTPYSGGMVPNGVNSYKEPLNRGLYMSANRSLLLLDGEKRFHQISKDEFDRRYELINNSAHGIDPVFNNPGSSSSGSSSGSGSSSRSQSHSNYCKECNGTGYCLKCHRSGIIKNSYSGEPMQCPRCSGSGKCKMCYGTGRIR